MDVEFQRVQRDGIGVLGHVQIDHDRTPESQSLEVGLQDDGVVAGNDIGREKLPGRDSYPASHLGTCMDSAHGIAAVRAVADRVWLCAVDTRS